MESDPDRAAPTVDLRTVLVALSSAATSAARSIEHLPIADGDDRLEPLLTFLDVEERVLFDVVDRVLDDGPELTAAGRARHRDLLRALGNADVAALQDALDAHVEAQRRTTYPQLLHTLDADGQEDLAAAVEEARLSREEIEGPRPLPLEP